MTVLTITIVGFKVTERKSVYYKTLEAVALGSSDDDKLLSAMKSALEKSDVISVRCISRIKGE